MNPIQAIIIDDEPGPVAQLSKLLGHHRQINILASITNPVHAADTIEKLDPDLIFLDIQMPGLNGFELVDELTERDCCPSIIFVTAYDQLAIEAIRHSAFDFLLKPVEPDDLERALRRFAMRDVHATRKNDMLSLLERTIRKPRLKIPTAGGFTMIDSSEIIYIQADWNYAELYLTGDRKDVVSVNIGALEELLPKNDFFRVNRSSIINVAYLVKVNRKNREATLAKDGREYKFSIPILKIRKLEKFLE